MNIVYKSFGYIRQLYNQVNPATLTGAIDIVVIEQPDGSLIASPFHVRFGKLGVLRAKEKMVNIAINDEKICGLHMKLGDQGEAFFLEEFNEEDAIPLGLITSPLPSRPSTPDGCENNNMGFENDLCGAMQNIEDSGKRRRRKKRKRRNLMANSTAMQEDKSGAANSSSEAEEDLVFGPSQNNERPMKEIAGRSLSLESNDNYILATSSLPTLSVSHIRSDGSSSEYSISLHSSDESAAPDFKAMRCVQSDSELPGMDKETINFGQTPFSDSEATEGRQRPDLQWGWGQLPARNDQDRDSSSDDRSVLDKASPEEISRFQAAHFRSVEVDGVDSVRVEDETPLVKKPEVTMPITPTSRTLSTPRQRKDTEGLYLDDILSLEPSEANLYLQQAPHHANNGQSNNTEPPERAVSPGGSDIDSGTDCQIHDYQNDAIEDSCEVAISLCGFVSGTSNVDGAKFDEKQITYESFVADSLSIINDPNLVIRLGESRYLNWQTAAPFVMSLAVFGRPLSTESLERIIQSTQPSQTHSNRLMGWLWRRPNRTESISVDTNSGPPSPVKGDASKHSPLTKSTSLATPSAARNSARLAMRDRRQTEGDISTLIEDEVAEIMEPELVRSHSAREVFPQECNLLAVNTSTSGAHGPLKPMRKSTRLNSDQLKTLRLEPGTNTITFSVTSQYQGTTRCQATVFLWKWSDKLVVSDIDGTITKSDVFGQILPVVGKDWTQGGVAQLYQNISKNGYKFLYVSARAIGQASMTKGYLNWVSQQGVSLPAGPLLLSPTSLMIAFKREVIEKKPEKFKIECLKDIKALFPENPFVAGFGNKTNDVFAYSAVGVPPNRMFTINHRGELKHEQLPTYTSSYTGLGELVDNYFPSLQKSLDFVEADNYSDFTYWREAVDDFSDQIDQFELV